ncbi:MAG: cob(I)yrinic acid a,c-diamide adenosyltransferase [Chloroflexota bacterium]
MSSANDLSSKSRTGLVQIFTGEGKGKTTAAAGTVLRALSHGLKVFIVVFMKGSSPLSGEWTVLSKLPGVKIATFGARGFTDPQKIKPETREQARQAFETAREAVLSGDYDLVVLDEINVAVDWKLVDEDEVVRLIEDKPSDVELILTGRYAHPKLVELADLVTECLNIKHPYNKGIKARPGIEY